MMTTTARVTSPSAAVARSRETSMMHARDGARAMASRARRAESSSSSQSSSEVVVDNGSLKKDARYTWRGHDVHYERSGDVNAAKHVVFLHGFGVGTFHYRAQLEELADAGACVWALDLCGQGDSWPRDDDAVKELHAQGFQYSIDTWRDQVDHFLRDVVGRSSYVAGNSLGGYLATYVSATSPELVRGLILMNATPFWAFVPNDENSLAYRLAPWKGSLPVPKWVSTPFKAYWDSFRSAENVSGLLGLVYASKSRIDDDLVRRIIAPTDNPNALSAFCSVVWSPKSKMSFDDMLTRLAASDIPIALVYGKEDPWVVPLWGQRLKRAVSRADYYEISPGGHCPAHECPASTNSIIDQWTTYCEAGCVGAPPSGSSDGSGRLIQGNPRNIFEKIDAFRASMG